MCFIYKDVLYADRFQIHDFRDFSPSLTDNKIFVSPTGKVTIAVMGYVPKDIDDVLERLERGFEVYMTEMKSKKDRESTQLTFEQVITAVDIDFMGVFRPNSKTYSPIITAPGKTDKRVVNFYKADDEVKLFTPPYLFAMLDAGMTPAQIFKGISLYKGTVSREFTAYDLKKKKFI